VKARGKPGLRTEKMGQKGDKGEGYFRRTGVVQALKSERKGFSKTKKKGKGRKGRMLHG